jgi:hypothetical protein
VFEGCLSDARASSRCDNDHDVVVLFRVARGERRYDQRRYELLGRRIDNDGDIRDTIELLRLGYDQAASRDRLPREV